MKMKIKDLEKRDDYLEILKTAHRLVDAFEEYSDAKTDLRELLGYGDNVLAFDNPGAVARRLDNIYMQKTIEGEIHD